MKPNRILLPLAALPLAALPLAALLLASGALAAPAPKLKSVTVAIRHRVFPEFPDQQTVVQGKTFGIGDTDYTGRIVQYVPDFAMELSTGKVISRSQEPKNPAFKLIVYQKGKAQDTTWAMMSLPPHFTRKSFLAFKVMRIDFTGRAPIVADSVAAVRELNALKEAALKAAASRPTDEGGSPHGAMGANPHGGAGLMNPHGSGQGASPHGAAPSGTASPHGGSKITTVPAHGDGSSPAPKETK